MGDRLHAGLSNEDRKVIGELLLTVPNLSTQSTPSTPRLRSGSTVSAAERSTVLGDLYQWVDRISTPSRIEGS